jgi:hypothetical protein
LNPAGYRRRAVEPSFELSIHHLADLKAVRIPLLIAWPAPAPAAKVEY